MTHASPPSRRRRIVFLCGATLLLHYLTIGWVGARIGLPQNAAPAPAPAPIVARLHAPAPVLQPVQVAPAPAPRPKPVRIQRRPPAPAADDRAAPPVAAGGASDTVADPVAGAEAAAERGAADSPADVESAAAQAVNAAQAVDQAQAAPTAAPPAPAEAAPAVRQYKASVPPSSELSLDLARVDANGNNWTGVASMSWRLSEAGYTMKVEAGISMLVTRFTLLELSSEGSVGERGFAPLVATEKRRGRAQTATHFNREQGNITFSASQKTFPLAPGAQAQDKATLPLQLAAIARADPAQLDGEIDITVGEDRDASVFRFLVVGQEEIETGLGKVQVWHLTRPPKPGSYNSRLDVWLAPEHGWYPVRIRNTEASGAVTTQTVSKIVITETGTRHVQ